MAGVKIVTDGADLPRNCLQAQHCRSFLRSISARKVILTVKSYRALNCTKTGNLQGDGQYNPTKSTRLRKCTKSSPLMEAKSSPSICQVACQAPAIGDYRRIDVSRGVIQVIDSRQASMGLVCWSYAAELAERGAEQAEIVEAVKTMSSQVSTYFMVDTLSICSATAGSARPRPW